MQVKKTGIMASIQGTLHASPPNIHSVPLTYDQWHLQEYTGKHEIREIESGDTSEPYGSILELIDVTHEDVGEFDCVESDFMNASFEYLQSLLKASRIYVFVHGEFSSIMLSQHTLNHNKHTIYCNRWGKSCGYNSGASLIGQGRFQIDCAM